MHYTKIPLFLLFLGMTLGASLAADVSPSPAASASPPSYPLAICVVSGDKLGQMGAPTIIQSQGTEVRFCCKDCLKDFNKDPEKYLKRVRDAAAKKNP